MCGRYRRTTREEELARIYRIPIPSQPDLPISYNIAPSQEILAIRFNPETKQRSLDRSRWGLVPYWAKDEKIGFKTINARAETVVSAHSFRSAFKKRRCLIPADGFYEWKKVIGGKIPYSIEMKDDSPFVFAGLWEGWQNSGNSGVAADLYDYHWRTQRVGRANTHSNARYTATGNSRPVADRGGRKGDFATVPSGGHENKSCLKTGKQTRK
jgi:putative SOS response-associated peptidase YedK